MSKKTIHEKLSLIQQEFKSKKSRFNSFGKYNFRSAEDILEALKPFNKKYNVYFTGGSRIFNQTLIIVQCFVKIRGIACLRCPDGMRTR